jgi:prepilin-type N-terminal cleavage/methylation domain-containing protein
MSRRRMCQRGFSLAEILVVIAIILLIAGIAIPHLLHARIKANEAAAVANVRTIQIAESVYQNTYPDRGYSPNLINLGSNGSACETTSPTNACLIDSVLAGGLKGGYIYELSGDGNLPVQAYSLTATPQSSTLGSCSLSANQSGSISALGTVQAVGARSASSSGGGIAHCGGI